MLQRCLPILMLLGVLLIPCSLNAQAPHSFASLTNYLNEYYPPVYTFLSKVQEMYNDRLTFFKKDADISRGQELLVLRKISGVPQYLLPQSAVIRVESLFENKVLAQEMARIGENMSIGDPVVQPASPILYLYTNIKDKDLFSPYTHLLQSLLDHDYEVVEVYKTNIKAKTDRYGLLLRLEAVSNQLVVKVQSLYSGDTFFSQTLPSSQTAEVSRASGVPVLLARSAQPGPSPQPAASLTQGPAVQDPAMKPAPEKEKSTFQKAQKQPLRDVIRLNKPYSRFVICQTDSDPAQEIALLNHEEVEIFDYVDGNLRKQAAHTFSFAQAVGLHLHALDIDADGDDELMITLGVAHPNDDNRATELRSQIVTCENGEIRFLSRNMPYYLRVIEDRSGQKVLLGQRMGDYEAFAGDIHRFIWDEASGEVRNSGSYAPAANIYSVYQFNLAPTYPENVLILEPSNFVSTYYTPDEEIQSMTDKNYGDFDLIPFEILLEEPEFVGFEKETKKTVFVPRRFLLKTEYDNQSFLINKQRQMYHGLNKVKNLVQGNAEDSLVGIKWNGSYTQQTWDSKTLAKDILDFGFSSQSAGDTIFVLVKDMQGFSLQSLN